MLTIGLVLIALLPLTTLLTTALRILLLLLLLLLILTAALALVLLALVPVLGHGGILSYCVPRSKGRARNRWWMTDVPEDAMN